MAKSKFDFSLLKPVQESASEFDESQLMPVEEQTPEEMGAFLDSLPKQQDSYFNLPRSVLAGLTNLGRNLHNLPHDIALGAESSISNVGDFLSRLTGKDIHFKNPHALSNILPFDETNYANVYGQEGEGTLLDRLVQKGIEYSPEIGAIGKLSKAGLSRFPITQAGASKKLRMADKIISDLNTYVPLSATTIEEARPFLPRTHATSKMLEAAEQGDYPSSFSTQSQVGHHGRLLKKSQLPADRLLASQADELKQNMLSEMEGVLRSKSHLDPRYTEAADLIRGGINDYKDYIKFRENVWPLLKKLGIPTTALAVTALGANKAKKTISSLLD